MKKITIKKKQKKFINKKNKKIQKISMSPENIKTKSENDNKIQKSGKIPKITFFPKKI